MRKPFEPSATDFAFWRACELRVRLGQSVHHPDIPVGIAQSGIEHYVVTGLRDHAWPLTELSLRVAQMRSERDEKAASERLWSEENP